MTSDRSHGVDGLSDAARRLRAIARTVVEQPRRIRELELLDQLAVALILDRREFLPGGEFTMLQAVDYLGEERVRLAIAVEKILMRESFEEE